MTHNTANTIGFISFLCFVGYVCFLFQSAWFLLLLIMCMGGFRTDKELEKDDRSPKGRDQ